MKRVLRVRAEMDYDIRPVLPCQLEAFLKARDQAVRIHTSRLFAMGARCENQRHRKSEWRLFETLVRRADARHWAFLAQFHAVWRGVLRFQIA